MRISTILIGLTLSSGLLPAQQIIRVTPQTLAGWTIVGTEASALTSQPELTLPAGAQLTRFFDNGELGLQLKTHPVIGLNESDWPTVELGSTALIFSRNGTTGKLLLAVGGQAPQPLPVEFTLDAQDRSKELLVISLSRQGTAVIVETGGQIFQSKVSPDNSRGLEIVASAGASTPWTFQSLEVSKKIDEPVRLPTVDLTPTSKFSVAGDTANSRLVAAGFVLPDFNAVIPVDPAVANVSPSGNAAGALKFTLEIFTPPAVRRGRADELRILTPVIKK